MPFTVLGTIELTIFLVLADINHAASYIDGLYNVLSLKLRWQRHEVALPTKSVLKELMSDNQAYNLADCLLEPTHLTARTPAKDNIAWWF